VSRSSFSGLFLLILKGLFGVNSEQFGAFFDVSGNRFIDSKRVIWRKFGEMSQIFLFDYFPLSVTGRFPRLGARLNDVLRAKICDLSGLFLCDLASWPLARIGELAGWLHIRQV
jgi:hypothetical protein